MVGDGLHCCCAVQSLRSKILWMIVSCRVWISFSGILVPALLRALGWVWVFSCSLVMQSNAKGWASVRWISRNGVDSFRVCCPLVCLVEWRNSVFSFRASGTLCVVCLVSVARNWVSSVSIDKTCSNAHYAVFCVFSLYIYLGCALKFRMLSCLGSFGNFVHW